MPSSLGRQRVTEIHMVKNRQKGITKAYRNDKKDVDTRVSWVTVHTWIGDADRRNFAVEPLLKYQQFDP